MFPSDVTEAMWVPPLSLGCKIRSPDYVAMTFLVMLYSANKGKGSWTFAGSLTVLSSVKSAVFRVYTDPQADFQSPLGVH